MPYTGQQWHGDGKLKEAKVSVGCSAVVWTSPIFIRMLDTHQDTKWIPGITASSIYVWSPRVSLWAIPSRRYSTWVTNVNDSIISCNAKTYIPTAQIVSACWKLRVCALGGTPGTPSRVCPARIDFMVANKEKNLDHGIIYIRIYTMIQRSLMIFCCQQDMIVVERQ